MEKHFKNLAVSKNNFTLLLFEDNKEENNNNSIRIKDNGPLFINFKKKK